ncbi:MAG: hypothetical protein ACW98X_09260 [Promethearchaeota archaeon]|jgi:hypothetical protein
MEEAKMNPYNYDGNRKSRFYDEWDDYTDEDIPYDEDDNWDESADYDMWDEEEED